MTNENNLKFVMRGIVKAKAPTCFAMARIAYRDEVVPVRPRLPASCRRSIRRVSLGASQAPSTPKGE